MGPSDHASNSTPDDRVSLVEINKKLDTQYGAFLIAHGATTRLYCELIEAK